MRVLRFKLWNRELSVKVMGAMILSSVILAGCSSESDQADQTVVTETQTVKQVKQCNWFEGISLYWSKCTR